jgi:hypothetical protein
MAAVNRIERATVDCDVHRGFVDISFYAS